MVPTSQGPLKSQLSQIALAWEKMAPQCKFQKEFQRPPSLWRPREVQRTTHNDTATEWPNEAPDSQPAMPGSTLVDCVAPAVLLHTPLGARDAGWGGGGPRVPGRTGGE